MVCDNTVEGSRTGCVYPLTHVPENPMSVLSRLLAAVAEHTDDDARAAALTQILAEDGVNLADVKGEAVAEFNSVNESGDVSEESVAKLEALVAITDTVQASLNESKNAQVRSERAAELAARMGELGKAEEPEASGDEPPIVDAAPEAPAEPAPVPDVVPAKELVSASVKPPVKKVDFSRLSSSQVPAVKKNRAVIHAAADISGISAGAELDGLRGLGQAMATRMDGLSRVGPGKTVQAGIAAIRHNRDARLVGADDGRDVTSAMLYATNERNLSGGSLVAAGGWCAPSETIYDLCDPAAVDGLVDIPEITGNRGGVRFATGADFGALYAGGFNQTEAEAIAGTVKPCIDVTCPSFTEVRMNAIGLCITAPILTNRAYPELIDNYVAQALAAHAHRVNAFKLARMVALSEANAIAAGTAANNNYGAMSTALEYIELHAEWIRYRHRKSINSVLEVVAPAWLRGALRADIAKKNGISEFEVSDARIEDYFRARKLRVQWVYDWQDALATGVTTGFGGTPLEPNADAWPATAQILIYPAGTFFAITADVITLDGIYDSTGLSTNEYTRLFTEEGVNVAKQCDTSIVLTIPVCTAGGSGIQVQMPCAGVATPA